VSSRADSLLRSQRAIACKAPRQRRHLWQCRDCGIYNLLSLKSREGFESLLLAC
jgi:hypothetical protein